MFRLAFVLTLCVYGSLGYNIDHDLEAIDREWSRGMPATSGGGGGSSSDCIKDMWIVWDNSWSVGASTFNNKVRPFLKNLIKSPQLNVGPDGTHIGILTFSTQVQTRVLLEMGQKKTQDELTTFLDSLNYDNVSGDGTRTGMALKMIDEIVGTNYYRSDVSDVVMLFTDGQPIRRRGEDTFGEKYKSNRYGEGLLAADRAQSLKDKDVTVVGLAVGSEGTLSQFRDAIKEWSSPGKYFEATKDTLQNIMDELISASCIDPGQCSCDKIEATGYAAQGGKATINWIKPTLKCASGREAIIKGRDVSPDISPPAQFGVGLHTVMYTYRYMRGLKIVPQKCPVDIFVATCKCPPVVRVNREIASGSTKAFVSWKIPEPNCEASLTSVSPPGTKSSGNYKIGKYEVRYHYQHSGPSGTFTLTCPVEITIKGQLCGGIGYDAKLEVCCCGEVHPIRRGYECCGHRYYDTGSQRCAEKFTIVDKFVGI